MELHALRTFVVVAEEGSVTKAAKRLFMTPPSVTAHIKSLEQELQVQLFVRTSRGMQITEKGQILRNKAEQTIRAAQELVSQAAALQTQLMGQVTLGLNASAAFLRLAGTVTRLQSQHPGVKLTLVNSVSGKILAALRQATLDIGYVFGPVADPALCARRVAVADLVVAVPGQWAHLLAHASWETLARLPWLYADLYCPFQEMVDQLFAQQQLPYRRLLETSDEATKCELVSAGIGLALLEASEAQAAVRAGTIVVWQPAALRCDLSLVYARVRAHDPIIGAVAAAACHAWGLPNEDNGYA
jgi:DNA-binding transcriptional LysR family regulator